jgi:hypothetical protein
MPHGEPSLCFLTVAPGANGCKQSERCSGKGADGPFATFVRDGMGLCVADTLYEGGGAPPNEIVNQTTEHLSLMPLTR